MEEQYPSVASSLGSNYGCIDLAGLTFTENEKLFYIEVQATDATIFYRTVSEQGVIHGTENTLVTQTCSSSSLTYMSEFQFIEAEIAEKIYVDYEPEEMSTMRAQMRSTTLAKTSSTTNCLFRLELYEPRYTLALDNYNIVSMKITRHSIGTILGSVLSWLSILTMVALFIAPIMENTLLLIFA